MNVNDAHFNVTRNLVGRAWSYPAIFLMLNYFLQKNMHLQYKLGDKKNPSSRNQLPSTIVLDTASEGKKTILYIFCKLSHKL